MAVMPCIGGLLKMQTSKEHRRGTVPLRCSFTFSRVYGAGIRLAVQQCPFAACPVILFNAFLLLTAEEKPIAIGAWHATGPSRHAIRERLL